MYNFAFMRLLAVTVFLFFLAEEAVVMAQAPAKQVITGNQHWLGYIGTGKLNNKWSAQLLVNYWSRKWLQNPVQVLVVPALHYTTKQEVVLGAGMAYARLYNSEGSAIRNEYRPHQEVNFKQALSKIGLSHRLQLEERFFELINPPEGTDTHAFLWRGRYRSNLTIPIKFSEAGNTNLSLLLSNEVFLHFGKQAINVFDQNRIIAGPGWQLNPNLNVALRYMHFYIARPTPGIYGQEHVIRLDLKQQLF